MNVQVRKRKWENYSSGEELFGLAVTSYPELEQTEKEVSMLDRLYRWAQPHTQSARSTTCCVQSAAAAIAS